jgi:hypothetical protein
MDRFDRLEATPAAPNKQQHGAETFPYYELVGSKCGEIVRIKRRRYDSWRSEKQNSGIVV